MKRINIILFGFIAFLLVGCSAQRPSLIPILETIQINFLGTFLATFLAGAIIASVAYFLIDHQLERASEQRAYRAVYLLLRKTVARMDYLEYWLGNKTRSDRPEMERISRLEIPERLQSSAYEMWEEICDAEIIRHFNPKYVLDLELALRQADEPVRILRNVNYIRDLLLVYNLLGQTREEALSLLEPFVISIRGKLGLEPAREENLRQQTLKNLIMIDQRYTNLVDRIGETRVTQK